MESLYVRSLRGDFAETQHAIRIAVVDSAGATLVAQGDVDAAIPIRSAAKPFQAVPLIEGPADRWALTDAEIALACASHNSEASQVAIVRALLDRIGMDEAALACGPHRPLAKELAYPHDDGGGPVDLAPPSPLASNCSGKHTGMLAVARYHDWPTEGYHRFGHAVQDACLAAVAEYCGVPEEAIGHSIDGCGAVCWAVPLVSLARGYAALAARSDGPTQRIVRSMVGHPDLIAGRRRLCTALMAAYPNQVLAKVGAGGVYGAAVLESGIGIALKVVDGSSLAAGVALLAVLEQLDLLESVASRLEPYAFPRVLNTRREVVGRVEAVGTAVSKRAPAS